MNKLKNKIILLALFEILAMVTIGNAAPSGNVITWGKNNAGQLGDGTTTDRLYPVEVYGFQNLDITAIAAGGSHSMVIKSDGTVWTWGSNYAGQLGDGTRADKPIPVKTKGLSDVIAIAAGGSHSIALTSDRKILTWGSNIDGQLGDGTKTTRDIPVQVTQLGYCDWQDYCYSSVNTVAAGGSHSLALNYDGTVWTWGSNTYGQLGDGTTTSRSIPVQVNGLSNIIAIAAGQSHSLALKSDGTVWSWGYNNYGQLGIGTTIDKLTPEKVDKLSNVVAIAAGGVHSLAIESDGTVWYWGDDESFHPVQISGLTNIIAISAGDYHSLALQNNGKVWAWGSNYFGQLGDGSKIKVDRYNPVRILTNVVAISGGGFHSMALTQAYLKKGHHGGFIKNK